MGRKAAEILRRLIEIHGYRVVYLMFVYCAAHHFSLLNFPIIYCAILGICLPSINAFLMPFSCLYLLAVFVIRRTYSLTISQEFIKQLSFHNYTLTEEQPNFTCPELNVTAASDEFRYTSTWIGFDIPGGRSHMIFDIISLIIVYVAVFSLFFVRFHLHTVRILFKKHMPPPGIVFDNVRIEDFDQNLLTCIKCFLNWGFYKFGLEICLSLTVIISWIRMDFLGCLLILWALLFVCLPRSIYRLTWPIFILYLIASISFQYVMAIGIPVEWCVKYPWDILAHNQMNHNVALFFSLANYNMNSDRFFSNIVADFCLLIIAVSQNSAFNLESQDYSGGLNASIYKNGNYILYKDNPRYDFIKKQRSVVDILKTVVFTYGHWITILCVLIAGLGETSLFALGYLLISFWMLWKGNILYTMDNYARTLCQWNWLAYYSLIVMFAKVLLQFFGCALKYMIPPQVLRNSSICVIEQLLNIVCINPIAINNVDSYMNELQLGASDFHCKRCNLMGMERETRIGFDVFAFAFILFQLRVLNSYFFQRCIIEFRCDLFQARRGAVLINQLIEKAMREETEQQKAKLDDIKRRVTMIRELNEIRKRGVSTPHTYEQSKRAGDYYMFEHDPDTDDLLEESSATYLSEMAGDGENERLNTAQLLHTALQRNLNMEQTVDAVNNAEKIRDSEWRMITAVGREMEVDVEQPQYQQETRRKDMFPLDPTQSTSTGVIARKARRRGLGSKRTKRGGALFKFLYKLFFSLLNSFSSLLNDLSFAHRYMAYVLDKEKEKMKLVMSNELYDVTRNTNELRRKWEKCKIHLVTSIADIRRFEDEAHLLYSERSLAARLLIAMGNCFMAYTSTFCYFFAFCAHAQCGGLITLPLPFFVLFWGTLSNPRPSRFFWLTMILYTEFTIVVKFMFQFPFWKWNRRAVEEFISPFSFQSVLGIQRVDYYAMADVVLLMVLFFHRYMLLRVGLWKSATVQETFSPNQLNTCCDALKESTHKSSDTQLASKMPAGSTVVTKTAEMPSTSSFPFSIGTPPTTNDNQRNHAGLEKVSSSQPSSGDNVNDPHTPLLVENAPTTEQDNSARIPNRGFFYKFFDQLFYPKFRYIRDLYPLMFFLDLTCFLTLAFGFNSFGEGGSGDVINDLRTNRVPLSFVLLLMIMTLLIIIDRGFYLRKAVLYKFIYHLVTIVFLHVWIFGLLPQITRIPAADNNVAKFFYVVKSSYFVVSAWQIRNGYPPLCIGNFLMRSYGLLSMIAFRIYFHMPFLFEVRTIINWTFMDTSMPLLDYINMENIYALVYLVKCARTVEKDFPSPRGQRKSVVVKYLMGIPTITFLVLIIWLPLLLFALLNTIGIVVTPKRAVISIGIDGFPPFYTMESQDSDLKPLSDDELMRLITKIAHNTNYTGIGYSRRAINFLETYSADSAVKILFRPESQLSWQISPQSMLALKSKLKHNGTKERPNILNLHVHLKLSRKGQDKTKEPLVHTCDFIVPLSWEARANISGALDLTGETVVYMKDVIPLYLIAPGEGQLVPADALLNAPVISFTKEQGVEEERKKELTYPLEKSYNDLMLKLTTDETNATAYWMSKFVMNRQMDKLASVFQPEFVNYGVDEEAVRYNEVIVFVDRIFPSFLTVLIRGSIVAMYAAVVLLVARSVRHIIVNPPLHMMISEIPNPDHLIKICQDIYLVREAGDFALEQDIFAKVIFLFRSPSTLLKWTRYKKKI